MADPIRYPTLECQCGTVLASIVVAPDGPIPDGPRIIPACGACTATGGTVDLDDAPTPSTALADRQLRILQDACAALETAVATLTQVATDLQYGPTPLPALNWRSVADTLRLTARQLAEIREPWRRASMSVSLVSAVIAHALTVLDETAALLDNQADAVRYATDPQTCPQCQAVESHQQRLIATLDAHLHADANPLTSTQSVPQQQARGE